MKTLKADKKTPAKWQAFQSVRRSILLQFIVLLPAVDRKHILLPSYAFSKQFFQKRIVHNIMSA